MKHITRTTASTKPSLVFAYGSDGQRISKQVGEPANGGYKEYYIRDASGNIMATYRYLLNPVPNTNPPEYEASLKLTERPIYGSSRIGSHTRQMEMVGSTPPQYYPYTQPMPAYSKQYELTDHLGNVTTVLTGRLLPDNSGTSAYQGEVLSAQGYEPFGMELPGRHWQSDVSRFGFQGQLKDREISAVPFKYRMYSPDGSGFWSIDPLAAKYPHNSPYAFSENRVIDGFELEGLEVVTLNDGGTVEGPYANADQALGAALDEKGPGGTGTKAIILPDLVIRGKTSSTAEYSGSATTKQFEPETPNSDRESLAHAVAGLTLEGAKRGVGETTFRLFNKKGAHFSPKLYNGWKGGSVGQIKTYGLGESVGLLGKGLGYYGVAQSGWGLYTGKTAPIEGWTDVGVGILSLSTGAVGGIFEVSYNLGKVCGPSKWYGEDDRKWFE